MARSRISWNANQEARLRKAVSSYNAAVTRMAKSGKYTAVPNKTTFEQEKSRIETRDELRQREKELGRILVKNKKDANEPVNVGSDEMPFIVPKYMKDEISLAVKSINKERLQRRLRLFTDAGDVSKELAQKGGMIVTEHGYVDPRTGEVIDALGKATAYSDKNLNPLNEDNYRDGDDLDDVWDEKYPQTYKYAEQYKEAWMAYNGDPMVLEVIDYMADHYPDELKDIFDSGDDEVEINFIYDTSKSSDKTPTVMRHNAIKEYWGDIYYRYAGTNIYFYYEE